MKSRSGSGGFRPLAATSPSFYTYLKPGALAKLRYSKITARSKETGAQALITLCQLNAAADSAAFSMDGIPCFNLRVKSYPRCLQRKKLTAATPFIYDI